MISLAHSGNCGDVIYALPSIRKASQIAGEPVTLYLKLDVQAFYSPENSIHPIKTGKTNVMLNKNMYNMVRPLLMAQSYIKDVKVYMDEPIDIDLDMFRTPKHINTSAGHISRWYFYHYPQLSCDINIPTIEVTKKHEWVADKIIINKTQRYNNPNVDYSVLKPLENALLFVGVDEEYHAFCNSFKLAPNRLNVVDFIKLAEYIASCRMFIGNQSMAFAIAEQLKVPRIVETYPPAPNCIPIGGEGHEAYSTGNLVYHVNNLLNITKNDNN
jgi:hypothetical protein